MYGACSRTYRAVLLGVRASARFERLFRVRAELKIKWAEGKKQVTRGRRGPRPLRNLPLWDGEKEHLVRAWRGSVLVALHDVAADLTQTHPWEPSFAAWLVLTDEPIWVPRLLRMLRDRTLS
jgi:hypothetical protein